MSLRAIATLRAWCPRPLDDGAGRPANRPDRIANATQAPPTGATSRVQKAHTDAAMGIELRQCSQSFVADSTSGSVRRRAISVFTGRTTKKNTLAAISTNEIKALKKSPYRNTLSRTVNVRLLK